MSEYGESFLNITRHKKMNLVSDVIPTKVNANVSLTCPVSSDFVVLFENVVEVFGMFTAHVFYAKVVNSEDKLERSFMAPKSRNKFALVVSMFVQAFFEEFIGE